SGSEPMTVPAATSALDCLTTCTCNPSCSSFWVASLSESPATPGIVTGAGVGAGVDGGAVVGGAVFGGTVAIGAVAEVGGPDETTSVTESFLCTGKPAGGSVRM